MDSRCRMRSRSVPCRFWTENAQKMSFWCRKYAISCRLHAFRDRIPRRVAAAQAWAAWSVSSRCGWGARRTAGWYIAGWCRQGPERCALGAGFGRVVQSRSTWLAAWAWWAGSCAMRRVRVQPGYVWVRPCSIARFGDSCRGRRERIAGLQWSVVSSQWSVASGGASEIFARGREL